jgi:hypothetical protein
MMKNIIVFFTALFLLLAGAPVIAQAHSSLMSCFDNGDDTITCGGGFSDGSSAAGVPIRVEDADGNILLQGQMSEDDEFTFDKPKTDFVVIFDAGPGHSIREKGRDIVE